MARGTAPSRAAGTRTRRRDRRLIAIAARRRHNDYDAACCYWWGDRRIVGADLADPMLREMNGQAVRHDLHRCLVCNPYPDSTLDPGPGHVDDLDARLAQAQREFGGRGDDRGETARRRWSRTVRAWLRPPPAG